MRPFFTTMLTGVLFLFGTAILPAQKYMEIRDSRHNRSILAGDNADGQIYHQDANGRLNAFWRFERISENYYRIADQKHNRALVAGFNYDGQVYHNDLTTLDHALWELIDYTGNGNLFLIKDKKHNRFLTAGWNYDGDVYHQDTSAQGPGPHQLWRLVEREGSGINPTNVNGQEIIPEFETIFTSSNNSRITFYGLPRTICGEAAGGAVYQNNTPRPSDQDFMNSINMEDYAVIEGRKDHQISYYVNTNINVGHPDNRMNLSDPLEDPSVPWAGKKTNDTMVFNLVYNGLFHGTHNLRAEYGTTTMLLQMFLQERSGNGTPLNNIYFQIPVVVSGITNDRVKILGYTTQPQIPYLILHDPPGDGSYSEFAEAKTTCQKFEDSYETDSQFNAYAKIKIGVAGSAGFISTTDYEFSVTFSAGITTGDLIIEKNSDETCITVTNEFATSDLPGAEEGEDVFIGFGQDLNYAVYELVDLIPDSCKVAVRRRLTYAERNPGEYRKFIYTKSGIESDLAYLLTVVADSNNLDPRTVNNALNQIDVWNQVLNLNDENIANATENIGNVSFNAGTSSSWSETIKVVDTRSIETKHFIEFSLGLETVLEVGGSGFTGGFEYKMRKTYGATQNLSQETAKLIKYTLKDNDQGDIFNVDIYRDPMFGTPVFRPSGGTKSSCPYEGGYARDQPRLTYANAMSDSMVVTGVPKGGDASFNVMICNDSNEPRDYKLQLDDRSNGVLNAVVIAAGTEINNNPDGRTFPNVLAGECFPLEVIVRQTNQSRLNYPRLKLILAPECEDEMNISSDLYLSAYFTTGTSVNELNALSALDVYPNPSHGVFNIDFTLEKPEQLSFQVYDLTGRQISTVAPTAYMAGEHLRTLELTGFNPGVYHLSIRGATGVISKKLVIQE